MIENEGPRPGPACITPPPAKYLRETGDLRTMTDTNRTLSYMIADIYVCNKHEEIIQPLRSCCVFFQVGQTRRTGGSARLGRRCPACRYFLFNGHGKTSKLDARSVPERCGYV